MYDTSNTMGGLNNHEKSMEKIEATKLVKYNVSCLLA